MLSTAEKAYCAALLALKERNYRAALEQFEIAAGQFDHDREFVLYRESTRLLIAVKEALERLTGEEKIEIEEVFTDG